MDHPAHDSLAERLDRLEGECHRLGGENRRLKRLGALAGVGLVVLAACGARRADVRESIEAGKIVLKDEKGKERALLDVSPEGKVRFQLADGQGKPRLALIVAPDGSPVVALIDAEGKSRIALACPAPLDAAVVNLSGKDGNLRLGLGVDREGAPTVNLRDKEGNRRVNLLVGADGSGLLDFLGAGESQRARVGVVQDRANLLFFDKQEEIRLGMVVSPDGHASYDVFADKNRLGLGAGEDGRLGLTLIDPNGKLLFRIPDPAIAPNPEAGAKPAAEVDPGFGLSREKPIQVGRGSAKGGPAAERDYLDSLRDEADKPVEYERDGSIGPGPDKHVLDRYTVKTSSGKSFKLFLDMYHPEKAPVDQPAPKGFSKAPR